MTPGRIARALLVTVAIAATAAAAHAETPADRKKVHRLGGEALDLVNAKDYAAALAKFEEADRLVPAPTLKLHAARCLEKLGRFLEAAEYYRKAIATELKPGAPAVHLQARHDAVKELANLLEATPRLTVLLAESPLGSVELTIDGKSSGLALGQEQPFDPGFHAVVVRVGDRRVEKGVTLARGSVERLVLSLPPSAPPGEGLDAASDPGSSQGLRVAGIVLLGVGGGGLVLGAVSTGLLYRDRATLDEVCPGGPCFSDDPAAVALAERFNRERVLASAGFVGGGVLAAAGATLWLVGSRGPEGRPPVTAIAPLVGPGFVGISGRF